MRRGASQRIVVRSSGPPRRMVFVVAVLRGTGTKCGLLTQSVDLVSQPACSILEPVLCAYRIDPHGVRGFVHVEALHRPLDRATYFLRDRADHLGEALGSFVVCVHAPIIAGKRRCSPHLAARLNRSASKTNAS